MSSNGDVGMEEQEMEQIARAMLAESFGGVRGNLGGVCAVIYVRKRAA